MSDQNQASSSSSAASQNSPAPSDKTLVFPPLTDSPGSSCHGEQLFYTRNRLTPDRWSIEATEAILPKPTAEELFDRLMAERPKGYYHPNVVKPTFEPVYYDPEHPPQKYRRIAARAHENKIKKKLANSGLTEKEIEMYATNASYYPGATGSKYEPVRPWSFSMTPPRIVLTSEEEDSPRYLFKDLPAELPKKKIPVPSSPTVIQPKTADSPISLKRERDSLVLPPKTPDGRPIADNLKTPTSSFVDPVEHLSPVFDRMNVTLRRRRKFEKESLKSPLASIHETPEHPAKLVPFIKKGPMESAREPDKVIGAFRLKVQRTSDSAPTSSTEPISSSLLSPKGSVTTPPSSGYKPLRPIVLFVSKSVMNKYHDILVKFSRDFNVEIVEGHFDYEKITHVIFDEDDTDEVKLQNIKAIGFQKYLVRMNWVQDCISNGPMLDPALYEVEVPPSRVARISNVRLFAGYAFLCAKPFIKIKRDDLWALLVYNGGSIVFNPPGFADYPDITRICIIGELKFYEKSENKQQLRHKLEQWKCAKVRYQWIFAALESFSLPPMIEYLFDTSLEEMRDAGVPEDLIN